MTVLFLVCLPALEDSHHSTIRFLEHRLGFIKIRAGYAETNIKSRNTYKTVGAQLFLGGHNPQILSASIYV